MKFCIVGKKNVSFLGSILMNVDRGKEAKLFFIKYMKFEIPGQSITIIAPSCYLEEYIFSCTIQLHLPHSQIIFETSFQMTN